MYTYYIGRTIAIVVLAVVIVSAEGFSQPAPSTQPATQGARRGRGAGTAGRGGRGPDFFEGRGPATRSTLTGQLYTPMEHAEYYFGADFSSVMQDEQRGRSFKDSDGQVKPVLQIFKNHGYNWARLRTCVEPATLPQNSDYTIAAAREAKQLGYKWLLDFHYSNGWADPRSYSQQIPSTWRDMNVDQMSQALFEYTKNTIAKMAAADVMPDIIQVGNEVGNGFLFPMADITKRDPAKWDNFAKLMDAGMRGIEAGRGDKPRPRIMIHVDHGGDQVLTKDFFDKLTSYGIKFDIIGFSFYPWSHGTLFDLKANLAMAAQRYDKDVVVVETGYCNAPSQFRQLPGPFPESPEGQAAFLDAVNKIVMDVPNGRGKGVFYWEPTSRDARSYFDNEGNPRPIMNVFEPWTRPVHRVDNQ
jgi:arabinogalactan endo-1,4-beta-galactosidase